MLYTVLTNEHSYPTLPAFAIPTQAEIQTRLFAGKLDLTLTLSLPCREDLTFWIPASARMTDARANRHHQRPVTSYYLSPMTYDLAV